MFQCSWRFSASREEKYTKGCPKLCWSYFGSFGVKKDRTTTAVLSSKAHISYDLCLWFRVANFMQSFLFCCVLVIFPLGQVQMQPRNFKLTWTDLPSLEFKSSQFWDSIPKETQGPCRECWRHSRSCCLVLPPSWTNAWSLCGLAVGGGAFQRCDTRSWLGVGHQRSHVVSW